MRLLVVDDSIVFRHLVEAALAKEADIEIVGTARNGRKAIDALPVCRPELLTLDMEMPEMDGLATLAEIEKVNAARPRTERGPFQMRDLRRTAETHLAALGERAVHRSH